MREEEEKGREIEKKRGTGELFSRNRDRSIFGSLSVASFREAKKPGSNGRTSGAADDPESRLWTFTNASTLPVRVTTRVCTTEESVLLLSPPPSVAFCPPPSPPPLLGAHSRPPPPSPLPRRSLSSPFAHPVASFGCPPRPAVLLEARRGGPLDSPVNPPPPPPLPPPPRRDHVSSTSLEFTGILGLSIRHPEFQILRSHASISSFFSRSRVSRSGYIRS